MRSIGAVLSCTLAVGLIAVLVGCTGGSPMAPTPMPTPSPAAPLEWTGNGHHYQLSLTLENEADHFLTWTQARAKAESLSFQGVSGHLVTITSAAENAFLVDNIVPPQRNPAPLIGGFQPPGAREPDGGWRWVTGEPFTYTNWASGEPNEGVPDADFMVFTAPPEPTVGTWNDIADLDSGYIIEYDTTPPVSTSIVQRKTFSGNPAGIVTVSPFDPALGTLDSVDVLVSGTLTAGVVTPPFFLGPGILTPYSFGIQVSQDFSGLAGRYFNFEPPAEFLFADLMASGAGDPVPIVSDFTYGFSFTDVTDGAGAAVPTSSSSFGTLTPPAQVRGTRADFLLGPPSVDQIRLDQTWQVTFSSGPTPAVSSVAAQGSIQITYNYTFFP